ncbi:MAG: response regulator transcription factor [Bryobacterales bacterium]|nr:response regulator transcription factor [Bryobacterales bacterium]
MIRTVVADDHDVVRKGVLYLLSQEADIEVAGEASDGREAVRLVESLKPHVLIMDIAMPQLNGIDAAAQLAAAAPGTAIILLSMYSEEEFMIRALNAGVRGYLLKDSAEADLIRAVRAVASGKTYFSPEISHLLVEDYMRRLQSEGMQDSYRLLTDREREVLQLLAEGKSNRETAGLLNLSLHTVETHRTNLMRKLGLHNIAEIVAYAMRKRIIS